MDIKHILLGWECGIVKIYETFAFIHWSKELKHCTRVLQFEPFWLNEWIKCYWVVLIEMKMVEMWNFCLFLEVQPVRLENMSFPYFCLLTVAVVTVIQDQRTWLCVFTCIYDMYVDIHCRALWPNQCLYKSNKCIHLM